MGLIVPDAIEQYLSGLNRMPDAVLRDIEREGRELDLPLVDAEVGALLRVLALAVGARQVLEIGTAIGYSTIWLAGALPPDGRILTMEIDPGRAKTAGANLARAGLADRALVMVGDSARLVQKVSGPFDLIFQDGDKHLYEPLLDPLVARLRPGGLLVTDNVLWSGDVVPGFAAHPANDAESGAAIASYNRRLSDDPRLLTSIVPLRDGLAISIKRSAVQ